eukprot:CAMPEP_0184667738 /NCGR_PEP_ID=MMETSP0308-20130426/68972_1 /TAXON_ID=38269 /ORGANISM="Gloeochaete witrockiana, Strain SAG 46.84" /LENGTH=109 /DNA_ID=CAMNT_0027113109 /DNA_START=94 /DNA_END=423 /DNA_ORIENTATION=-
MTGCTIAGSGVEGSVLQNVVLQDSFVKNSITADTTLRDARVINSRLTNATVVGVRLSNTNVNCSNCQSVTRDLRQYCPECASVSSAHSQHPAAILFSVLGIFAMLMISV